MVYPAALLLLYTISQSFQRVFFFFIFFILFSWCRHTFVTIISYYNNCSPRGEQGLCFKWYLKSQSFFILIPDGEIRPAPLLATPYFWSYTYHSHAGICHAKTEGFRWILRFRKPSFLLRALSACLFGAYMRYIPGTWRGLFEPSSRDFFESLKSSLKECVGTCSQSSLGS